MEFNKLYDVLQFNRAPYIKSANREWEREAQEARELFRDATELIRKMKVHGEEAERYTEQLNAGYKIAIKNETYTRIAQGVHIVVCCLLAFAYYLAALNDVIYSNLSERVTSAILHEGHKFCTIFLS